MPTLSTRAAARHHGWSLLLVALLAACGEPPSEPNPTAEPGTPAATSSTDNLSEEAAWHRVEQLCGGCHATPQPDVLPRGRWPHLVQYMNQVIAQYQLDTPLTQAEVAEVTRYYVERSPLALPVLEIESTPSPIAFAVRGFGAPPDQSLAAPPFISNLLITDLDQDGAPDVLVSDARGDQVSWVRRVDDTWQERSLAAIGDPAGLSVVDVDGDGDLDIAVAILGIEMPSDEKNGGAVLLINDGALNFTLQPILRDVPRTVSIEPADFDGDGDVDFSVAVFGGWVTGHVAWLEQTAPLTFEQHIVYPKNGAIHVPPVDFDGDGRIDFIALVTQAHEEIVLLRNRPDGRFEPIVLWEAGNPMYGCSGLELVDLDQDGDLDILFTNGDALDIDAIPKPYHGIQWLENQGDLKMVFHSVAHLYGAYRALAGDLDQDGDLDIVATSQYNRWDEPGRQSMIWLENDGAQGFSPHTISTNPTHLVTADMADLDGDGRLDILAGGMHIAPPFDRVGRVTAWWNLGRQ